MSVTNETQLASRNVNRAPSNRHEELMNLRGEGLLLYVGPLDDFRVLAEGEKAGIPEICEPDKYLFIDALPKIPHFTPGQRYYERCKDDDSYIGTLITAAKSEGYNRIRQHKDCIVFRHESVENEIVYLYNTDIDQAIWDPDIMPLLRQVVTYYVKGCWPWEGTSLPLQHLFNPIHDWVYALEVHDEETKMVYRHMTYDGVDLDNDWIYEMTEEMEDETSDTEDESDEEDHYTPEAWEVLCAARKNAIALGIIKPDGTPNEILTAEEEAIQRRVIQQEEAGAAEDADDEGEWIGGLREVPTNETEADRLRRVAEWGHPVEMFEMAIPERPTPVRRSLETQIDSVKTPGTGMVYSENMYGEIEDDDYGRPMTAEEIIAEAEAEATYNEVRQRLAAIVIPDDIDVGDLRDEILDPIPEDDDDMPTPVIPVGEDGMVIEDDMPPLIDDDELPHHTRSN